MKITIEKAFRQICEHYPDCPVVLWSAKNDPELMEWLVRVYYVGKEENAMHEVLGATKAMLDKRAHIMSVLLLVLQLLLSAFLCYCLYWPILLAVLPTTALTIFAISRVWVAYDKAIKSLLKLVSRREEWSVIKEIFENAME